VRLSGAAWALEFRDGDPVARTKAPESDSYNPTIITSEEYERLLRACARRPMLWLYVLPLGESGLRADTEALQLQWDDVDLDRGFLQVTSGREGHRTTSGNSRWAPMTARLEAAMQAHFARHRFATYKGKRNAWVFHHDRDHHKCHAGARIVSLYHGFKSAAKRAKLLPFLRQHDLRHRRIIVWLAEGKNPVHVKEALGHSDLRTTMGYSRLAREHLRALVESAKITQEAPGQTGANPGPTERQPRATAEG
jgi:integrase